ncbi:hypothetical protein SCLCIDRAFT_1218492 [Scleroderma citrinum Foug A]|uniref:Uncharacterized protein n=1 Tax=Scleroderma citrinum Foug A TaxID=1036808 RepID=A0A0C3DRC1_9AGAM|nr:hypothetical protein SCLCIDRAFT_1218492 [Scleroderma citrinum Foug A]
MNTAVHVSPAQHKKRVDRSGERILRLKTEKMLGKGKRTTQKHHAQPPQLKQPRAPDIFIVDRGPSCKETLLGESETCNCKTCPLRAEQLSRRTSPHKNVETAIARTFFFR